MRVSGWCSAPEGARPQHEKCRSPFCRCDCGCAVRNESAQTQTVERDSQSQSGKMGLTNQDGPGSAPTLLSGASPTGLESTVD